MAHCVDIVSLRSLLDSVHEVSMTDDLQAGVDMVPYKGPAIIGLSVHSEVSVHSEGL